MKPLKKLWTTLKNLTNQNKPQTHLITHHHDPTPYPLHQIKNNFYKTIKQEPQFCHIKIRYLPDYLACQTNGIETPNADIAAIWKITQKAYIFYIDDQYYAGDIIHDKRPHHQPKQTGDHEFYIRLLYKIQ